MKVWLGKLVLKLMGWKLLENTTYLNYPKSVLIAAPHTSNWDFVFTIASMWALRIPGSFFIKDSYTKGFAGGLFKALGAIGINRSQKSDMVEYAVELLKNKDRLVLIVPAEGTRKRVDKWKTGFFHIARAAGVPVVLSYLDYKQKTAGVGKLVFPAGRDFTDVMAEIQDFYKDKTGKIPENFNPIIY